MYCPFLHISSYSIGKSDDGTETSIIYCLAQSHCDVVDSFLVLILTIISLFSIFLTVANIVGSILLQVKLFIDDLNLLIV